MKFERRLRMFFILVISFSLLQIESIPSHALSVYSFTNASASGRQGPTQAQINTAYAGTTLAGAVTINTRGIQEWTVPSSGKYLISIAGASGGNNDKHSLSGGLGAYLSTEVDLVGGDILNIVVGQAGVSQTTSCLNGSYCGGSGGGGSFVYKTLPSVTYLVVAGGGGGAASNSTSLGSSQTTAHGKANSTSGSTTSATCQSYSAAGGTGGNGGSASTRGTNFAGPGAGINSSGGSASGGEGLSRAGNWVGGYITVSASTDGGFGGGGAAGSTLVNQYFWAGGGGGYSGGGGGFNSGCGDGQYGGGGGSYSTGTLKTSTDGANSGNGYVTITQLSAPVVSVSLSGSPLSIKKGQTASIVFSSDSAGKVIFYADNKRIAGCINLTAVVGNVTCYWKPNIQKSVRISAVLLQGGLISAKTTDLFIPIVMRTGTR